MKPVAFDYARPQDLAEALALLAAAPAEARLMAGGQSLGPMLNLRLARPALVIDIRRLPELAEVREGPDGASIGAAVTHAAIEDGRIPDPTGGALARVAAGIAYRAVRNRGTIGGSLAHADPAADWVTALTALGADCVLAGPEGRRTMPVAEFVRGAFRTALGPAEILVEVRVPRLSAAARFGWYKVCRKPGEFATAIGAVLVDPERGVRRAVMGATAGRPVVIEDAVDFDPAVLAAALAGQPGLDAIDRQVHGVALRRAAAMTGSMAA